MMATHAWFRGLLIFANTLALILTVYLSVKDDPGDTSQRFECPITFTQNEVIVNCNDKNMLHIPDNLPLNTTQLVFSNNNLISITGRSIGCFSFLHHLDFRGNNIRNLEKGAFDCVPRLTSLFLNSNQINYSYASLPIGLFSKLRRLKKLSMLDMTPLKFFPYPEKTFADLTRLDHLELDMPSNVTFGPVFANMKLLKTLHFIGELTTLTNETFKRFSPFSIKELNIISKANIVEKYAFLPFQNVTHLVLREFTSGLVSLMDSLVAFVGRRMDVIKLNGDNFPSRVNFAPSDSVLTPNITRYLVSICVKELQMRGHELTAITKGTFEKEPFSKCIRYIDVSSNCLILDKDIVNEFMNLRNLEVLIADVGVCTKSLKVKSSRGINNHMHVFTGSADRCQLLEERYSKGRPKGINSERILASDGDNSTKRKEVWSEPNWRTNLYCDGNTLTISIGKNLKKLHLNALFLDLNIYNCTIDIVGGDRLEMLDVSSWDFYTQDTVVRGLENLQTLYFSDNFASFSSNFAFHTSSSLRQLQLNRAEIDTLIEDPHPNLNRIIDMFKELNSISLISTGLKDFPFSPKHLNNLSFIDLSDNSINSLSSELRASFDERTHSGRSMTLDLTANMLSCGCNSLSFVEWLKTTDVKFKNWDLYRCLNDDGDVVKLSDFVDTYFLQWRKCNSKFLLSIAISMAFLISATVAIAVLVDKNIHRLRCFVLQLFGVSTTVPRRQDFQYDVFIYYAQNTDYQWACNIFREEMEVKRGLRLCIPDRDFVPGACTAEEILEAIHNSWKTVVCLTEQFLDDDLCSFTLSSAVYASNNQMPNRLFIIYENAIFEKALPPIVVQLLDGNGTFMFDKLMDKRGWDLLYERLVERL